ncbi:serine/threonine-protein kinase [Kitasatospora arboriphila]
MDRLGRDDPLSVGPYRLTRRLGAGGMGRVYLGHTPGGYPVAVKVAHRHIAVDHRFRFRFRREIDAALRVSGLYTARVVEADPEAELPWMATEYIEGPTLDQRLARGHLDPTELGRLGSALAEALTAIHKCKLVHRDLKPSNIIMAANGPRVIDFGIAHAMDAVRTTTLGRTLGTRGYIAPEQSSGVVRPASDIYALGMVLVHAAGGDPFDQGGRGMRRPYHEPDLTALPAAMRPFVGRCLDPRPERRPQPSELIRAFSPDPAVPRQWPAVATWAPPGPPADRDERSETAPAAAPHAPPPPPLPAWPDAPTQTAPPPARPEPDGASGAGARPLPGPISAVEFRMSRLRRLQVATESLAILLLPPVLLAAAAAPPSGRSPRARPPCCSPCTARRW